MKRIIFLVFAMIMSAQSWAAVFYTGNDLIDACEKRGVTCTVFMMGVADTVEMLAGLLASQDQPLCIATGVTGSQLARVMAKYMDENPESLNLPAAGLAFIALIEAFPCDE